MALKPYLDTTIATYFDNQPVYVLNPEKIVQKRLPLN